MIQLICFAVIAAFLWPAVGRWSRRLDAALELDALRPAAKDVAVAERELPHMPFDPHYPLNALDVEFLEATAAYWEAKRTAVE